MTKGIVIGTSQYTKDFLNPLLDSLAGIIKPNKYPILIVSNGYNPYIPERYGLLYDIRLIVNDWNGWEPAVIMRGRENFDEFIHLMDTTIVKDISLFDKLFAIEGNVVLTKGNFHFQGKFVSKTLPTLPKIFTKDQAIMMETRWLPEPYTCFEPDLKVHSDIMETVHNQYRMRLENDFLIKWKGTFYRTAENP
jgi:hypothetical protein